MNKHKGKITKCFLDSVKDIQAGADGFHKIPIQKVGVRNIKIPFTLAIKDSKEVFKTIATVSSYCELSSDKKGINMSRISRSLNEYVPKFGCYEEIENAVRLLKKNHESETAWIKVKFEYVIKSKSPISNINSYEPLNVEMQCKIDKKDQITNLMSVKMIAMSLCPCSKNMSLLTNNLNKDERSWYDYLLDSNPTLPESLKHKFENAGFGAHNQKSKIKTTIKVNENELHNIWIEDIFTLIQNAASSPTFTTIKREDEKFITEVSYMGGYYDDNGNFVEVDGTGPAFVEDIARNVAHELNKIDIINDYTITVCNQESIHSGEIEAVAVLFKETDLR